MRSSFSSTLSLPLRGSLSQLAFLSILIAVLMAGASLAGLLLREAVYPTEELLHAFFTNDLMNLGIGVPILLVSVWLAQRGRLLGLLWWPGALFFVVYSYLVYVLSMPFSLPFLVHLALVMLSLYTLVALLRKMDGEAVQARLGAAVRARLSGGVLAGMGIAFSLLAISNLFGVLSGSLSLARTEIALNITDLLVTPAWIIGGVLLWRRKPFGYLSGLGLLFQASMLFVAVILLLLLRPVLTGGVFDPGEVIVLAVMGLVCFVPFGLFLGAVAFGRKGNE